MFFYIFHHINHYLFKPTDKTDAAINVRTLIMGGIAYILFHGYLYSKRMSEYFFKDYFWWIVAIDVVSVSVIYRSYYGESIIREIGLTFGKKKETEEIEKEEVKEVKETEPNVELQTTLPKLEDKQDIPAN